MKLQLKDIFQNRLLSARFLLTFIFIGLIALIPLHFIYAKNSPPEITFGDLLGTPPPEQGPPLRTASQQSKSELVKKLLQKIEENGRDSLTGFYPTPIPGIATLADNVADYFLTPVPTLNPQLVQILADADNVGSGPPADVPKAIGDSGFTPIKSTYKIAILGDSMVDTMGENLTQLSDLLKSSYPKTNFILFNYGQGATNIENGLFRLSNPTKYLDRDYPPLLHLSPDIIVVESFAYNHWSSSPNDLNRQWTTAVNILDSIKKYSPDIKIILLATISPNAKIYGDGKLNFSANAKWDSVITTKAYLQNFINFSESSGLPLADAYHASLSPDGQGDPKYIDKSDNLHPSVDGKLLISQKIAEVIKNNNLIK